MKQWKKTCLGLCFMYVLLACAIGTVYAEETGVQEKVLYNGMMIEGNTMIPMREAFESLGAEIEWEPDTMTVTARKGDRNISLRIGSREAELNGTKQEISAAPVLYEGVTRIPIRVASTALGATVEWDQDNRIATVLQGDRKLVIRVSAALEGETLYVYFTDPVVEKYIRNSLYLPSGWVESGPNPYYGYTGPIQQKHLEGLKGFHHSSRMKDLTGLQYAKNIDSLSFEEGTIQDVSFLQEFKSLIHLVLPSDVKGIETLHKLDGLVALTFDGPFRQMDELGQALAGMKSLEVLNIYDLDTEHVDGLAVLAGNPNFKWLNIYSSKDRKLKDISGLSKLVHLERLQLQGHLIDDLHALSSMTKLDILGLSNNRISDLGPLRSLTNLTTIDLSENVIENVEPISHLTKLESLILDQNQIRSVEPLGKLTRLQSLGLSNNQVADAGALASIPSLSGLELANNDLSDLSSLSQLQRIEQLNLADNQIVDLQPLAKLRTLRSLNVSRNRIQDITPLKEITKLQGLDISWNEVSSIAAVASMSNLEEINISETQVHDASALLQAPKLFQIFMQNTQVVDEALLQKLHEKVRKSMFGYLYY
jgi:internalin A